MENFFKGIWAGLGKVLNYRLIGPVTVFDAYMLFLVVLGIWRGWGDSNAMLGWFMFGWFVVESHKNSLRSGSLPVREALSCLMDFSARC